MKLRPSWGLPLVLSFSAAALAAACGSSDSKKRVAGDAAGEGGAPEMSASAAGEGGAATAGNTPVGGAAAGAGTEAGGAGGAGDGGVPSASGGAAGETGAGGAGTPGCAAGYVLEAERCVPLSCAGLVGTECQGGDCCASPLVTGSSFFRGTGTTYPATVSDFALDKLEVTVGRFKQFMSAYAGPPVSGKGAHPAIAGSGWNPAWNASIPADKAALTASVQCDATYQTWSAGSADDLRPINCVSWYVAFAFCAWDGGRLPTEAEWEFAAAGGNQERIYPWGDTPVPSNLQDSTTGYATYYGLGDGSAAAAYSLADILPAGSKPNGMGRFGQLDLAGSMWEWSLDWFAPYEVDCVDCSNLTPATSRVLRGGSAYYPAAGLAAANRDQNVPGALINDYGFRCARTP